MTEFEQFSFTERSAGTVGPAQLQGPRPHNQLIPLLSVAQQHDVDLLSITWQPARGALGRGAEAEVNQSEVQLNINLAFKNMSLLSKASISEKGNSIEDMKREISILYQPLVHESPNIIDLEGISWRIEETKAWPVFVYKRGIMLSDFLAERAKKNPLSMDEKLDLCTGICAGLEVLHRSGIVHADLKPENIIAVLEDPRLRGRNQVVPKISDFSLSVIGSDTDVVNNLPRSPPWNAPNHHFRDWQIQHARNLDVFSLGLICFWVLSFDQRFAHLSRPEALTEVRRVNSGEPNNAATEACRLTDDLELEPQQRLALRQFFQRALASEPKERAKSAVELLPTLALASNAAVAELPRESHAVVPEETCSFQLSGCIIQLTALDFRVRERVFEELVSMTKSDCDACRINCAQQAALCCELALGTERDLTARDTFLALVDKDKTVYEAIVAGMKEPHQPSSRSTLPYFLRPDLVHEYQRRKELEAASEHLDREIGGRKLFFIESQHHPLITVLQSCLAHVWNASGRLSDAASLQSEIVESNRQYYGENHPETIGALAQLAIFQDDLGHTKLAIEIGESVIASSRKNLSPDDPYLLTAMANLARIYLHAGRFTEAEALQEETVEKHEELLGPEHPNTMRCWLNLAAIYGRRPVPRAKESSRITAMIVKRQIETQGSMHRDALLAETYSALSEKSNSLATHEILARQTDLHLQAESLLADDDPDRWLIATNLASTQADLGEWDSAEKLFKEAIAHLELILPPGHREIVRVTALFGEKHQNAGLFAAGEKLLYKAMEQDRVSDQYSDDGVRALTAIGISRWEQGRREDAKDIFERVVDIVRSQWDIGIESHPTRTAMSYLADMYIEDGDAKKGLDFHERLVQWFINDQGPHSLFTIRTQSNMAMARMEAGLPLQPSIDLLTELLQRSKEHLGPSHGMTRIIQLNLGGVLSRNGDNERAIAVGEALLASLVEDPASSLIDALDAMQDLAVHYARAGKPLEAKALHVRISEAQRSSPDSPSKFRQMHNFANLCHEENDLAMAISHQRDLVKRQKLYYGDADREVWDSTYYLAYYLSDDPTQLDEALELSLGAWSFFLESLGYQHEKTINAAGLAGCIYAAKGLKEDARIMYERELEGSRAMGNSKVEEYVEHALKHLAALDE